MDHDRFSRNLPEALMKIDQLEKRYSLKVVATSESLDIDTNDPTVFMLRAFMYLVANQELYTIRKKAKLGIRQAQISGRYVSMSPFGYINAKVNDGKGVMKIDEAKAFIVQKIFRDYLVGIPPFLIYKEVKKMGFPNRGNGAITRAWKNPVYVVGTDKEEEKLIKGLHEPIITQEQYWLVQQLMETNKRKEKAQPKEEFLLRGILRSKCCGSPMTAGWSKGKYNYYLYYRCIKHSNVNVPGKLLHQKFDELLKLLDFTDTQVNALAEKVIEGLKEVMKVRAAQVKLKEEQLAELEPKLNTLEEKFITNAITSEIYRKWHRKYLTEKTRLQEELRFLRSDVESEVQKDLQMLPKLTRISEIYKMSNINQKHAILKACSNKIWCLQMVHLELHILIPISAIIY